MCTCVRIFVYVCVLLFVCAYMYLSVLIYIIFLCCEVMLRGDIHTLTSHTLFTRTWAYTNNQLTENVTNGSCDLLQYGQTPQDMAIDRGHTDIVKVFEEERARLSVVSKVIGDRWC